MSQGGAVASARFCGCNTHCLAGIVASTLPLQNSCGSSAGYVAMRALLHCSMRCQHGGNACAWYGDCS